MERKRRSIWGDITTSEKVSRLADVEALLYTWLILKADDDGRQEGGAYSVKWRVFPARPTTPARIDKALARLVEVGLIKRYAIGDDGYAVDVPEQIESGYLKVYIQVCSWNDRQSFHGIKRVPSDIPEYRKSGITVNDSKRLIDSPPASVDQSTSVGVIREDKRSKEKIREEEVVEEGAMKLARMAKAVRGWKGDGDDFDFFERQVADFGYEQVYETLEDLRLYQEAPKKDYKNLRLTLRNWLKREKERKATNGNESGNRRVGYKAPNRRNTGGSD